MASSKVRAIVRVSSGNFLEMYDFMVFGYYAAGDRRRILSERQSRSCR